MRNPFRHFSGSQGSTVRRPNPWRAVDHKGEVLEVFATKRRDLKAALEFLKRAMKRYGHAKAIMERQECGRWLSTRAEWRHLAA